MLRKENNMSFVEAGDVNLMRMEIKEKIFYLAFDNRPEITIEPRSEAIRSRASILIHREESGGNLIVGKGGV